MSTWDLFAANYYKHCNACKINGLSTAWPHSYSNVLMSVEWCMHAWMGTLSDTWIVSMLNLGLLGGILPSRLIPNVVSDCSTESLFNWACLQQTSDSIWEKLICNFLPKLQNSPYDSLKPIAVSTNICELEKLLIVDISVVTPLIPEKSYRINTDLYETDYDSSFS